MALDKVLLVARVARLAPIGAVGLAAGAAVGLGIGLAWWIKHYCTWTEFAPRSEYERRAADGESERMGGSSSNKS